MRLLFERKARLEKLILAANANWLHYSENFDHGLQLLAAAECRDAPYCSGKLCGWIKIKCATWREATKGRWRLFERQEVSDRHP
jgi:hypothetical protein